MWVPVVSKLDFIQAIFYCPSYQTHQQLLSLSVYETEPVLTWLKKNMPCLSHLLHISTHGRLHFPKVQRGFSPALHLYLPHRPLTAQGETQSEMHCRALNALWIALVSQEPAFHVSDFSQGALMLIHFTLLTHLFFFRLSYLFWAFKYICGGEKLSAVIVQFLKWDFNDEAHSTSPHWDSALTTQDAVCESWFL